MNGSHLETMEELYAIYQSRGDEQNTNKYRKKIDIIRKQLDKEAEEIAAQKDDGKTGIKDSDALDKERKLTVTERIVKKGEEKNAKLEKIRAERAESMDDELAEAMKLRKK